ncbi:MAG: F0F1 ATP synthase subunit epsilon [Legionellales bacterium]|jgi:F-type H+-transporting ATPase subunit epsilon
MSKMIQVDIVSAEKALFSGKAESIVATAIEGEVGILPNHAPLLAELKPGEVRVNLGNDKIEIFYISGGMLEVQPDSVTILADTAERAKDLDEAKALQAQQRAEQILQEKHTDFDYAKARSELAMAAAQLRAIQKLRDRH